MIVGQQELRSGKAYSGNQNCWQNFKTALESAHGHTDPQRHNKGQNGELTSGNGADRHLIQAGDGGGHNERYANGSEGHRGGIGDQCDAGAPQRGKSQAHQHGSGNGHGRAESCSAFNETAECICDEQRLKAAVICKAGEGILDDFKLAGFHGHVIDPYCRDDDPHDGEETEGSSIESGADRQGDRHPPYGHSYNQSTGKTSDCCNVSLGLADGEHVKEDEQWDCRHAGGNDDAPDGSVFLNPGHDLLLREIMSLYLRAGYPKAFLP